MLWLFLSFYGVWTFYSFTLYLFFIYTWNHSNWFFIDWLSYSVLRWNIQVLFCIHSLQLGISQACVDIVYPQHRDRCDVWKCLLVRQPVGSVLPSLNHHSVLAWSAEDLDKLFTAKARAINSSINPTLPPPPPPPPSSVPGECDCLAVLPDCTSPLPARVITVSLLLACSSGIVPYDKPRSHICWNSSWASLISTHPGSRVSVREI